MAADPGVQADPGRGDVILNPFDSRSARWDPFGEFSERFEIDQLVLSASRRMATICSSVNLLFLMDSSP